MGGYDVPDTVKPLTVKQAADVLGLSEYGTRKLIERGELQPVVRTPVKLAAHDVERLRVARQDATIIDLVGRGVDMVRLAQGVRRRIRPLATDPLPGGEAAIKGLSDAERSVFGPAALQALALGDPEACTWCETAFLSRKHKVPAPKWSEVTRALLGDPCPRCMQAFAGPELARLRARVHPSGVRPSAARSAPSAGSGRAAVSKPSPRPAEPVQGDDGGRALVARRLRVARQRLRDARRRGDQAYAIRMRQMVQALEADAAVVDGRRVVTASARPGVLACGHLLAADCSCPRRASKR